MVVTGSKPIHLIRHVENVSQVIGWNCEPQAAPLKIA